MNSGLQILKLVVNETKLKLNKKSEYCFTSLLHIEAISQQKEARSRDYTYSYFELFQGFFLVHSTLDIAVHSMPLNSMEHCICTTMMTNIRPERHSNLVHPGYKPQSI